MGRQLAKSRCRARDAVRLLACLCAGACTHACACGTPRRWNLPAASETGFTPELGAYTFDRDGAFSVRGSAQAPVVRFSRNKLTYYDVPVRGGAFQRTFGALFGNDCPSDSFAIAGAFVGPARAEGLVEYARDCKLVSRARFVALRAPERDVKEEVGAWTVVVQDGVVEVHHRVGHDNPQLVALHEPSGYLRLNPGPGSAWGTSVVLPPSFWTADGRYHQGAPVDVRWRAAGENLLLAIEGALAGIRFDGSVELFPPDNQGVMAQVELHSHGQVALADKPRQAWKPVMLSSMHISERRWDARAALAGDQAHAIPVEGWVFDPALRLARFGFAGGSSDWQAHTPSVQIELATPLEVTGWITRSDNPNHDNASLWATTRAVLASVRYLIRVRR